MTAARSSGELTPSGTPPRAAARAGRARDPRRVEGGAEVAPAFGKVAGDRSRPAAPAPGLSADQALAAVIDALADNDHPEPDHGVRVLHAFASDRMRAAVGDLDAFRRALHNELYAPLVSAREIGTEGLERRGDSARATLAVGDARGGWTHFTVALARSPHGERSGSWLLSGIARAGVDL